MDLNDLYSTRIQKSFDEDSAEIVSILKAHSQQGLRLINYYKGLPLSYPATIASIDRGTVDLDVQEVQAFTIEQARSTFIRSPLFKHDVFAQAQYVNIKKRAATFIKFTYVEIMAERRNFIRIDPDPNPVARIETQKGVVEGTVCDISLAGLNILVQHSCPLEVNTEVPVSFVLKHVDTCKDIHVSVPASLINITGDRSPYNYKFSISLDKMIERELSHYIFQRQVEIIREIKDVVS